MTIQSITYKNIFGQIQTKDYQVGCGRIQFIISVFSLLILIDQIDISSPICRRPDSVILHLPKTPFSFTSRQVLKVLHFLKVGPSSDLPPRRPLDSMFYSNSLSPLGLGRYIQENSKIRIRIALSLR